MARSGSSSCARNMKRYGNQLTGVLVANTAVAFCLSLWRTIVQPGLVPCTSLTECDYPHTKDPVVLSLMTIWFTFILVVAIAIVASPGSWMWSPLRNKILSLTCLLLVACSLTTLYASALSWRYPAWPLHLVQDYRVSVLRESEGTATIAFTNVFTEYLGDQSDFGVFVYKTRPRAEGPDDVAPSDVALHSDVLLSTYSRVQVNTTISRNVSGFVDGGYYLLLLHPVHTVPTKDGKEHVYVTDLPYRTATIGMVEGYIDTRAYAMCLWEAEHGCFDQNVH